MVEYFGNLSQSLGLPINAASHGLMIDYMIGWTHWVMLLLFVGWGIYLIITIIKFSININKYFVYITIIQYILIIYK